MRCSHNISGTALWALIAIGPSISHVAEGAEAWETPAAVAPPEQSLSVSGYLDVSVTHFDGAGRFANGTPARVFDVQNDGVTLHQASLTVASQPKEGIGGVVNLVAGRDANVFAPYDLNPGARSNIDAPQAYLQYATGGLTLIAGRFVTLAGYETLDPTTDRNSSRSILYGFAIPFAHTGVRATYLANSAWSLDAGIVNGWDDFKDTNSSKTLELGVTYTPDKAVSVTLDGYLGRERVVGLSNSGPQGQRALVDLIVSLAATDALTVVLNYDWGRQAAGAIMGATARWTGVAGYVNYAFNDHWRLSIRGESLGDADGYRTGYAQTWKEATLTAAWLPGSHVEARAEVRRDRASQPVFVANAAYFSEAPDPRYLSQGEASFALEVLYKF